MISITTKINGKTISPDTILDELEKLVITDLVETIQNELKDVKCTVHNEQPEVLIEGESVNDLSIDLTCCCEKLETVALEKLH